MKVLLSIFSRGFPFLAWLRTYRKDYLRPDLISGLTVALVLIPQSMAYAQLAGLPAHYGLYAAFLPPALAALFGSSRQLATGPVAVVSLLTSASLAPLATSGSEGYIHYAIILSLAVGIFQLALGLLRLGLVVNFLSHPVVNGFSNGAAIIIATSQLSKLFGVSVDEAPHHYETVIRVVEAAIHHTHWPTFIMAVAAFGIMFGIKKVNPRIPYILVAVVVTTLASWALGFERKTAVPVSNLMIPRARELIVEFNRSLAENDKLGEERAEANTAMTRAAKEKGEKSREWLEANIHYQELCLAIDQNKKSAGAARRELREMLFARREDGKFELRSEGGAGPAWRLKVGSRALDDQALTMFSGGEVVGTIPRGLPKMSVPEIKLAQLVSLLPYAVIISLLGFMEAISIAKAMAGKTGQTLDPNQELIGQGIANIGGCFSMSYPVSGSFSRSAVNLQSGAMTGLSSVITSVTVLAALLFFTPFMYHLPQATLAAVIMMAVTGLISVGSFVHSFKSHRVDGTIQVITFVLTLIFAPHLDKGIMVGVGLSLGVFIYNSMRPRVAGLSLHPDLSFKDAARSGFKECKHIAMIRFDAPLFFANASFFEETIKNRVRNCPELKHILLVANGINDMDVSGEEVLALTVDYVRAAGIDFSISGLKENVYALMRRTHLIEKIGKDHIFPMQSVAVRAIYDKAHRGSDEEQCPLVSVCPSDAGPTRRRD